MSLKKECTKCRKMLDVSEFAKDAQKKTGLQSHCRDCFRVYYRQRKERDNKGIADYMIFASDVVEANRMILTNGEQTVTATNFKESQNDN